MEELCLPLTSYTLFLLDARHSRGYGLTLWHCITRQHSGGRYWNCVKYFKIGVFFRTGCCRHCKLYKAKRWITEDDHCSMIKHVGKIKENVFVWSWLHVHGEIKVSIYLSALKMQTFNQDTVELALSYYRLSVLTCIKMALKHNYCGSILLRWFQDSFTFTISVRSYNALIWFIFLPCLFFPCFKI